LETLHNIAQSHRTEIALGWEQCFWDRELEDLQAKIGAEHKNKAELLTLWGYWPKRTFSFNVVLITRELFLRVGGFMPALRIGEEDNLIQRILLTTPDILVSVSSETLVCKRYDQNSLAWSASRGNVPWGLVSMMRTCDRYDVSRKFAGSEVRRCFFDDLYRNAAYAWQNGHKGFALQALEMWRQTKQPVPGFSVWYQNLFHKYFGFEIAERLLSCARAARLALPSKITPSRRPKPSAPQ
jgi:hypothetical protein